MPSAPVHPRHPTPRRLRRVLLANLVLSVVLGLALFAMLLYLSSRHYAILHTPSAADRPLSEKTLRLLSTLTDDVHVYALLRPTTPATAPTLRLLDLYAAASPYVRLHVIDPDRDVALAEQTVRQYAPPPGEGIIVALREASRTIAAADLLTAPTPTPVSADGESARGKGDAGASPAPLFMGEPLLSSSLYDLLQPTPPLVSFLQGHGEHNPLDFSPAGYSAIAALLRQDNLDVGTLLLPDAKSVPPQTALLVIAGPASAIPSQEIALLRDYLNRKGRLLVLLDALAPTDLDPLLREWGVALDQDAVFDPARTLDGRDLHVTRFAPDHPVTASLSNLQVVLHFPRSIRPADPAPAPDDPVATPLLLTSPGSWADVHPLDDSPRFNPQADLPGPVPLALAVERGPLPGVRTEIRPTRLVVVGDSDFAANASLRAANPALFLNAVNWLVERPDHLGIPPAPLPPPATSIPAAALRRLALNLILLLPLAVAILFLLPRLFRPRRSRRP